MNKKKEDTLLDLDGFLELLMSEYRQCKNKIVCKTFYIIFIIPSFFACHMASLFCYC